MICVSQKRTSYETFLIANEMSRKWVILRQVLK
jgi:hypothetical protein